MKKLIAIIGLLGLAVLPAAATIFTVSSGTLNADILDGNPAGYVNRLVVNNPDGGAAVRDVNVLLNITGGYNGDLYGYLVNPNGQLVMLLNRVGTGLGGAVQQSFGYADAGFNNVTLDDSAGTSIHAYGGGVPTGSWQAEGALSGFGSYATPTGTGNGTWTLFLADLSGGSVSTLVSWGLEIDVVPEPATWALIIFGTLLGVYTMSRRWCAA